MSDLRIKIILFDINNLKDDFLNLSYITEEDKINALKYKNLLDQKQHIVSSYLKRKYVKDYYLDEFKKPKSNNIFFNVSHSKNLVGIALGNVDLGLDIEFKDKDRKEELINYVCNQDELNKIKEESDFYKIWTSKESLLKCVGTGLVNDIKNINSLPLNGLKKYNDSYFYSHYIDYFAYSISVTLAQNKDFDIDLIIEEANYERIISTI
jgi:phosphopantetheinyl transferase